MKIVRPLQDRVIVKRLTAEEVTKGGLYIPTSAQEKPTEGIVVAVGNGRRLDDGTLAPMNVAPGDRVLFGKYTGVEVTLDGEKVLIFRETDIIGVLA